MYPPPTILVSRYNQYWRNFLMRTAARRNDFKFMDFVDENDLKMKANQIASNPAQTVWILLSNKQEYELYRQMGIGPSRNIGYIVHSPFFTVPTQTQDLIFGSNDPE